MRPATAELVFNLLKAERECLVVMVEIFQCQDLSLQVNGTIRRGHARRFFLRCVDRLIKLYVIFIGKQSSATMPSTS